MVRRAKKNLGPRASGVQGVLNSKVGVDALRDADEALDAGDDFSSKWAECLEYGKEWGGAGFGGAGVRFAGSENLEIDNISLQYVSKDGTVTLLQNARLCAKKGQVYGLVGKNGSGKTTLLRRIASKRLPGVPILMRIAYLAQEFVIADEEKEQKVIDACLDADVERRFLKFEIDAITCEAARAGEADKLGELLDAWERIGADGAEELCREYLGLLGFSEGMIEKPVSYLSGGWLSKLNLAKAFAARPDLLLLDEPTNHLDFRSQRVLTGFIQRKQRDMCCIISSHDEAFLDQVVSHILQLDHFDKQLLVFTGNYSGYLSKIGFRLKTAAARAESDAKEQARMLKSAAKLKEDEYKQKAARNLERRAQRVTNQREDGKKWHLSYVESWFEEGGAAARLANLMRKERDFKYRFEDPAEVDGELLWLLSAEIGYRGGSGRPADWSRVLSRVTLSLSQTKYAEPSRVAVVGENGSGKSTLVNAILKMFDIPQAGLMIKAERVVVNKSVRIASVSQDQISRIQSDKETTLLDYFLHSTKLPREEAQQGTHHLGSFGLASEFHKRLGALSGGQRTRLALALASWLCPHILVLDEPTNHLDTPAIDALSAAVRKFRGCVIIVSHNLKFLEEVCNEVWKVEEGRVEVRPCLGEGECGKALREYIEGHKKTSKKKL